MSVRRMYSQSHKNFRIQITNLYFFLFYCCQYHLPIVQSWLYRISTNQMITVFLSSPHHLSSAKCSPHSRPVGVTRQVGGEWPLVAGIAEEIRAFHGSGVRNIFSVSDISHGVSRILGRVNISHVGTWWLGRVKIIHGVYVTMDRVNISHGVLVSV